MKIGLVIPRGKSNMQSCEGHQCEALRIYSKDHQNNEINVSKDNLILTKLVIGFLIKPHV